MIQMESANAPAILTGDASDRITGLGTEQRTYAEPGIGAALRHTIERRRPVNIKRPRAGRARSPQENKVAGTANAEAGGRAYHPQESDRDEMHDARSDSGRTTTFGHQAMTPAVTG
jgi:hypothetical protein